MALGLTPVTDAADHDERRSDSSQRCEHGGDVEEPRQDDADGCAASLATLTYAGLQRLKVAWPAHLAGVRALVLDPVDPGDLADFNRVTRRLLSALENTVAESCPPV